MARAHEATRDSGNGKVHAQSADLTAAPSVDGANDTDSETGFSPSRLAALAERGIAPLIIILFISVAVATAVYVYRVYVGVTHDAETRLSMMADMTRARLIQDTFSGSGNPIEPMNQTRLADAMPETASSLPVIVFAASPDGTIISSQPFVPETNGQNLNDVLRGAPDAYTQGRFAGFLDLHDNKATEYLAVARRIPMDRGYLMMAVARSDIREQWHREARFSATILLSMDLLVLLIGMAFNWQANRLRQLNETKTAERIRLATALSRGRCGLWEWDLEQGAITFSDSMCALIGMPAKETSLTISELEGLTHPDDVKLRDVAKEVVAGESKWIDHAFRLRHADGGWVWLRARADVTSDISDPERLHLFGIAIDITDKKKIEAISEQADRRLHDAIETISESFVLWDADEKLAMCNSKFIEQNGLGAKDSVVGCTRTDIAKMGDQSDLMAHVQTTDTPIVCRLKDGRWLNISERKTRDGGIVSIGTDITELKRHEEKLVDSERTLIATVADLQRSRQALQVQTQQLVELADRFAAEKVRAELASKSKSDFLANMSHELRTPLNAIMGFSEILAQETFGPIGKKEYCGYAKDIHSSGKYLFDLITDILDMSKIEAGRYELECSQADLSELTDECVRIMALKASEKDIEMKISVARGLKIFGDRRAIKQILINLMSNAVKFTGEGGKISLRVRQVRDSVVISMKDNGVGIPHGAISRLGRPFEQAANQFTKNHQGSGLGLAISRSLAELHNGSLRIYSREGTGTIVTVRLPVKKRDEENFPVEKAVRENIDNGATEPSPEKPAPAPVPVTANQPRPVAFRAAAQGGRRTARRR